MNLPATTEQPRGTSISGMTLTWVFGMRRAGMGNGVGGGGGGDERVKDVDTGSQR